MKTYKVAAMVRHSGKHLQLNVDADCIISAIDVFKLWIEFIDRKVEDISELDITELSDDN